jgi:hypothetical protein
MPLRKLLDKLSKIESKPVLNNGLAPAKSKTLNASKTIANGKKLLKESTIGKVARSSGGKTLDLGDGYKAHRHGNDANGNHCVWVSHNGSGAKKIQTNGNCPTVSRETKSSGEISAAGAKELKDYHSKYVEKGKKSSKSWADEIDKKVNEDFANRKNKKIKNDSNDIGGEKITEWVEHPEFDKKWKEHVPLSGEAETPYGEAIRALGRLEYDYYNNGYGNARDQIYSGDEEEDYDSHGGDDSYEDNGFTPFYADLWKKLDSYVRSNTHDRSMINAVGALDTESWGRKSDPAFKNAVLKLKHFLSKQSSTKNKMVEGDSRNRNAAEAGSADAHYHRGCIPNKSVDGKRIALTDPKEIAEYKKSYADNDEGRYGGKQWDESVNKSSEVTEMFADQGAESGATGVDDVEQEDEPVTHRITVIVTDPNATAVTMRKEEIQKIIKVKGGNEVDATNRAVQYYKKRGYKVIDTEYLGLVEKVTEDYDSEDNNDEFYVALYDEEENTTFIGCVSKNGSKWHESTVAGPEPTNWGSSTYMSYLTPDDIMGYIYGDYKNYEVKGPFADKSSAITWATHNFGPITEEFGDEYDELFGDGDANRSNNYNDDEDVVVSPADLAAHRARTGDIDEDLTDTFNDELNPRPQVQQTPYQKTRPASQSIMGSEMGIKDFDQWYDKCRKIYPACNFKRHSAGGTVAFNKGNIFAAFDKDNHGSPEGAIDPSMKWGNSADEVFSESVANFSPEHILAKIKAKNKGNLEEDPIIGGLVGMALAEKGSIHAAKNAKFNPNENDFKNAGRYTKEFVKGIVDPTTYLPREVAKETCSTTESVNHLGEKEYQTMGAWIKAVKNLAAGIGGKASAPWDDDHEFRTAYIDGKCVGTWGMDSEGGVIYNQDSEEKDHTEFNNQDPYDLSSNMEIAEDEVDEGASGTLMDRVGKFTLYRMGAEATIYNGDSPVFTGSFQEAGDKFKQVKSKLSMQAQTRLAQFKESDAQVTEAKPNAIYTIKKEKHRTGSNITMVGTLPELIDKVAYTLETGASYQHEKGNAKINRKPTNIASLIKNLNNAVNNSAANGYAGIEYSLVSNEDKAEHVTEMKQPRGTGVEFIGDNYRIDHQFKNDQYQYIVAKREGNGWVAVSHPTKGDIFRTQEEASDYATQLNSADTKITTDVAEQVTESYQDDIADKLTDQFAGKFDKDTVANMVSYLIAGGDTFKKGHKYYELCKAACDMMGFYCNESIVTEDESNYSYVGPHNGYHISKDNAYANKYVVHQDKDQPNSIRGFAHRSPADAKSYIDKITSRQENSSYVAEDDYDGKPYGVRYIVFAGKEQRAVTKEAWFKSADAMERGCAKIEALGNFYEFRGYHYPKEEQGIEEDKFSDIHGIVTNKKGHAGQTILDKIENLLIYDTSSPKNAKTIIKYLKTYGLSDAEISQVRDIANQAGRTALDYIGKKYKVDPKYLSTDSNVIKSNFIVCSPYLNVGEEIINKWREITSKIMLPKLQKQLGNGMYEEQGIEEDSQNGEVKFRSGKAWKAAAEKLGATIEQEDSANYIAKTNDTIIGSYSTDEKLGWLYDPMGKSNA